MRYAAIVLLVIAGCHRPAANAIPDRQVATGRAKAEGSENRRIRVRRDAYAIQSECERAASGDWLKWENDTARFRTAFRGKLASLAGNGQTPDLPLAGRDMPIFEGNPHRNLAHMCDLTTWGSFRKTRPVVAADRWLRAQGIDLIFISVPMMPEVYTEQFLTDTPPDGIIAPHVRETFLELLESDVEVVDTYPMMREARRDGFLYLPADHHWNQVGMRGTIRDVAARLMRYQFARDARTAPPCTKTRQGPYALPPGPNGNEWRPPDQHTITETYWKAALTTLPKTMDFITAPDGTDLQDDPHSPIVIIGNSFAMYFRELLIRETNLPVRTRWGNANTTEGFAGFLREPEALQGARVVIWVVSNDYIFDFKPLPDSVLEALRD
jgi:SGNH hydrolase-like domain, acetyltransferase AlgX